jgi:signal transduction histidine kinase
MRASTVRRVLRGLWPHKVRLRLTLLYAALFLIAGGALLGLTYGLVAASLPTSNPSATSSQHYRAELARLKKECKTPYRGSGKPQPATRAAQLECKQISEYLAGVLAGAKSQRERALSSLLLYSLLGLGMMTVASGGAGWFISGRVLRPIRAITDTARRASEQHLGERIGMAGPRDELRELAETFDDMLERLDRAFAAQRVFVANASHELRTPLTVMRTAIDVTLAKPGRTQAQLEDMAERVRNRIEKAERMIDGLLTLSVSEQGATTREFLDLSALTEDALDMAAADVQRLGLTLLAELAPAPTVGDPKLLERMVWNLVDNAVRHNEPDGWIRVTTSCSAGQAVLRIANGGSSVPPDAVPAIFEPFRRVAGRTGNKDGFGLGLSIVRSVTKAHDAALDVHALDGGGLEVCVTLHEAVRAREPLAFGADS